MMTSVVNVNMPMNTAGLARSRRRRKDAKQGNGEKRFVCQNEGCERSFTRAEHLQRHLLNHSTGDFTCRRCRAHFKRRDLLDRHMSRHQQKDEEAGAEGHGILNTRKRMWKDAEGNIVTKKPALDRGTQPQQQPLAPHTLTQHEDTLQSISEFALLQQHNEGVPISPPTSHDPSLGHSTFDDHDSVLTSGYPPTLDAHALSVSEGFSPIDQQFWDSSLQQPESESFDPNAFNDAPFDDIFNPDTASSFNNPFTTMSNYNWLFDMDLSREAQIQPIANDPFPNFQFNDNAVNQHSHAFDLQLDHMAVDKSMSTAAQYGSLPSHKTDSPQQVSASNAPPLITPPLTNEELQNSQNVSMANVHQTQQESRILEPTQSAAPLQQHNQVPADLERPMSMLYPSRCLPIIDELARAQVLDLVDITQPVIPDGSVVTRDHHLLSLSCLQIYCDLFFTRFNTVYPLIHMSTFDPSHVDTLLLTSVLLLGATYGEKDAHQLAVCIHDVLRPQIFANAGFSAKPDLWVLQTILLVECFGKSRAGQKQHDMSHLFHGLLINLIRRSDCQTIRSPTPGDATDDLEDDWRTWVDAEQKKRLAFLCFMWDTQHAVLFCQSLCMSAFELRSNLPSSQSLWEADSAESWHTLHRSLPPTPLFLTCLKMYLNPSAACSVPKNLNVLSHSLLLHGLMSIAWDMQRRDQTSLGVIDTNPLGNWQTRLATSYASWNADFETFSTSYLSHFPSPTHALAKEFHAYRAAVSSLYHSAHILLHTPFLDLQIYAGARHILGRPVARPDYVRSQKCVKKWVSDNMAEASIAVWHAAALVKSGVDILDCESGDLGGGRLWHLPWAVYLGTLVVWGVCYASPASLSSHGNGDEDEIIWDPQAEMKGLLDRVLRSEPRRLLERGYEGGIVGAVGRRGTNGLAAVVSKSLSKVRWAVVHDGMMVLRGLVCWRLVGGGGMG
ncbi:hypothetical protein P280DRAFT_552757 [Massarina eburnea CBS 473.64]|uniref:C2H2-type domain-containing protein n=1 Tax=Massarina eburnea CBS 473.64 TaxID=1395130 RepID=A0A6A6RMS8_9PLEO|nr:hypothetical protein P280DRAFT_552757 [Massarina eburnea CBS 473.64]